MPAANASSTTCPEAYPLIRTSLADGARARTMLRNSANGCPGMTTSLSMTSIPVPFFRCCSASARVEQPVLR